MFSFRRSTAVLLCLACLSPSWAQDAPTLGDSVFARAAAVEAPRRQGFLPGEQPRLSGQLGVFLAQTLLLDGRATRFHLELHGPDGETLGRYGPYTSDDTGAYALTLPATATQDLAPGRYAAYIVDAEDLDAATSAAVAGRFDITKAEDMSLTLHASYVSSTGWVKPGETYPFRVRLSNNTQAAVENLKVSIPSVPSVSFTKALSLGDSGTVNSTSTQVDWSLALLEAGQSATLVVEAQAASLEQDPRVVWKDLSVTANLSSDGLTLSSATHGPKVIPPQSSFESARFGDKPFPMVLVDYLDPILGKHSPDSQASVLDTVVNDPDYPGSTFNLYQEMSYGQLFPYGTVPSAGIASAGWDYEHGFDFTKAQRNQTDRVCPAITLGDTPALIGSPLLPERIVDGWYQLPGQLHYYGWDSPIFPYTLLAGVPLPIAGNIDDACGPTGKAVYDAAQIADPEIDYNAFDSDKDGVVDFFMMVFAGCGGNGGSQLGVVGGCSLNPLPLTDNIWPHSSSLEFYYAQAETGLRGYVSDDQLKSLSEVPQCWLDTGYDEFADCAADGGPGLDELPVYVRVGPYNVNPETAFEAASVISHEYGHHLGLPDFYNSGTDFDAYGTMNLMASDYGQHMTIFGKQEMGWVVPQFLQPGETVEVSAFSEIKKDTGEIHWQTPDGTPYVLSAANGDQNIRNGQAYAVKMPGRILIDPDKVASQASGERVWYSGRGNEFGCSPTAGHNLDLYLPELADVPAGAEISLRFKSSWDIEWDWDYGFLLVTQDGGQTYASLPSAKGYSTANGTNPNGSECLDSLDNGLTGQSGTYANGGPSGLSRPSTYEDGSPFIDDEYDLSAFAGTSTTVRFSYYTDAAFDRPGWFIDDVEVLVNGEVLFASDHESGPQRGRYYPGGCDENFATSAFCTAGWNNISSAEGNPADHGYYIELRDRASFDFEGYGQADRGAMDWDAGLFIEYTDESYSYGNNGVSSHPGQHYIDSTPVEGGDCGSDCADSAFTANDGDNHYSDFSTWLDNFADPDSASGRWEFAYNCLEVDVLGMSGEQSVQLDNDLSASVRISAGEGCVPFTYGRADNSARSVPADSADGERPRSGLIATRGGALPAGWLLLLFTLAWLRRARKR